MRFDPYIRNLIADQYPEGYRAPNTGGIITQQGILDMTTPPFQQEEISENVFPYSLTLKAKLKAIPIDWQTWIAFSHDEITFPITPIYESVQAAAYRAVQLIFQKKGLYQPSLGTPWLPFLGNSFKGFKIHTLEQAYLYEKTFLCQPEANLKFHQRTFDEEGHDFEFLPLKGINIYPLWAYGGYYLSGCSIQNIQQTVFTLTTHNYPSPIIEIIPSPIQSWLNTSFVADRYAVRWVDDFQPLHKQSLAADIEKGNICFHLSWGQDPQGKSLIQSYVSMGFTVHDPSTNTLDIIFHKKEH